MPTATINLTTFNVENMFNRYRLLDEPWQGRDYEKMIQAVGLASVASREGDLVSYPTTEIQRNNTAQAMLDSQPDVLAVQEVENLYTLRLFNSKYLDDYFDRMILLEGNDPRGIDVGLLLRAGFKGEVTSVRTHADEPLDSKKSVKRGSNGFGYLATGAVFSRDCLEVDVALNGKTLTFMVNHFKAQDGTPASAKRRKLQAQRVAEIAIANTAAKRLPIILGDLNVDTAQKDGTLDPLTKDLKAQFPDPFPTGTWTHYYASDKKVSRLDYILPHKDLKVLSTKIIRQGLTTKCKQFSGPRYATVGQEHTEASDHCPTSVVLEV